MNKKFIVTLILLTLLISLVPKDAQGLDFTALPLPYDLEPGLVYQQGNMRFMYNNGYLSVWQSGGSTVYKFEWQDGWKEKKVIRHVIADLTRCIKSDKRIHRVRETRPTLKPVRSEFMPVKRDKAATAPAVYVSFVRNISCTISLYSSPFMFLHVQHNVREFVRNKVPGHGILIFSYSFLLSKSLRMLNCPWAFLYTENFFTEVIL